MTGNATSQMKPRRHAVLVLWVIIGALLITVMSVAAIRITASYVKNVLRLNAAFPGGQHAAGPVSYQHTPPMGGPHSLFWQRCGVYSKPIHNEHAVHSMEHGAVWITYRSDLAPSDVKTLEKVATGIGDPGYLLISPYPGLPESVVASAWGHQIQLNHIDASQLTDFIRTYQNGPDTPELGAPCTGPDAVETTADQVPLPSSGS